jgi:hypothetical protein
MALTGLDFKRAAAEVYQIVGRANVTPSKKGREVAAYDYRDEQGQLLFQCVRFEPKDFSQRRPDGRGGWIANLRGVRRVLYRLPQIIAANSVLVAEGERDVHSLEGLGFVATCNPMGAGKWRGEFSEILRGKAIAIFGDNDEAGRRHVEQVVQSLSGKASSIRVVPIPVGKDVSDWIAAGATHAMIDAAIQSAAPVNTTGPATASPVANRSTLTDTGEPYTVHEGCLYGWRQHGENRFPFKIANFVARIATEHLMDDGDQQSRVFTVAVELAGRTITVDVPAKDFNAMNWVTERVGGKAIVLPNQTNHARAAIQTLSGDIPTVQSYSHTGWRTIDGKNYYLHCGGAIGAEGNRSDIRVSLEDKLPNYRLPDPPQGNQLIEAIRSSLKMLDVTLDRLTFPVYGAIWRSILGVATLSVHIAGSSGVGKSQLAALAQQHFGPAMDADNLPASWLGTANATSTLAFHAKDSVLVVDDFVPAGNAASQQKLHHEADRLLRAQGNSAGRRRLGSDGKLLGNRPPRGLVISTGEDTPRGKSLNARMVLLNFPKSAMSWPYLTACQNLAAIGRFAEAAAGFIQWVAPRLQDLQQEMTAQRLAQRQESDASAIHMRTPENLYALRFGLTIFFRFAESIGAISADEARALSNRADDALRETAEGEARKHIDNDPCRTFLRLVRTAIIMGKAHLASTKGTAPDGERSWGWYVPAGMTEKQSRGLRIGWVKDDEVLLLPDAAHSIAARLAQEQGETLPGSLDIIKRDLKEQGLLVKTDEKRRTITVRRVAESEQHDVLVVSYETFQKTSGSIADNADNADRTDLEQPASDLEVHQ